MNETGRGSVMNDAGETQARVSRGEVVAGRPPSGRRPGRVALVITLVGLLITAAVCWTAWRSDRNNEHRLLQVQTRQAGTAVGLAILGIESPLQTALQTASVTHGSAVQFRRFMSAYIGPRREFVSASLWKESGGSLQPIASIGTSSALTPFSPAARRFLRHASRSNTVVVTGIPQGGLQRIGYALATHSGPGFAVYAERAIPANRRVPVESDSAFADIDFATYLGSQERGADLATTDVPPSALPLRGYTVRDSIPFGDTTLTLVARAKGPLGGSLGTALPWIFLVGGILLTLISAFVAEQLVTRRREAEHDARTITGLYEQMDALYGEQRTIAETLQHALLPQSNPAIPNLEIATRYVAGVGGVDIGGDWYSIVLLDDRHFAFVVGDVSGRGIDAATIMARLRFTIRAYLLEGHPPNVVLQMCARQLDVETDGHFATVLVGIGDVDSREITLANAGHLKPLLVSSTTSEFVDCDAGLPMGVSEEAYGASTILMPPGSMLLAFTDGLVERRGEGIDLGLQRLAEAACKPRPTLDELLTSILSDLVQHDATDDVAILAFRWTVPQEARVVGEPAPAALRSGEVATT